MVVAVASPRCATDDLGVSASPWYGEAGNRDVRPLPVFSVRGRMCPLPGNVGTRLGPKSASPVLNAGLADLCLPVGTAEALLTGECAIARTRLKLITACSSVPSWLCGPGGGDRPVLATLTPGLSLDLSPDPWFVVVVMVDGEANTEDDSIDSEEELAILLF